ncbi:MAG: ATP-binding cassette domain-containing protein, partial [Planctomycetia bacterium]|nr:ATP-binding cassette domain-containing protein [Planctomycetia bacterium]
MIVFHDATLVLGGRTVIDGLSLEVPAGHAMALIGRTGAGKTTLLAAAATAVRLERGEVALHGHSVRREP